MPNHAIYDARTKQNIIIEFSENEEIASESNSEQYEINKKISDWNKKNDEINHQILENLDGILIYGAGAFNLPYSTKLKNALNNKTAHKKEKP